MLAPSHEQTTQSRSAILFIIVKPIIGSQMKRAYEGVQRLVAQRLCAYVASEGIAYH